MLVNTCIMYIVYCIYTCCSQLAKLVQVGVRASFFALRLVQGSKQLYCLYIQIHTQYSRFYTLRANCFCFCFILLRHFANQPIIECAPANGRKRDLDSDRFPLSFSHLFWNFTERCIFEIKISSLQVRRLCEIAR